MIAGLVRTLAVISAGNAGEHLGKALKAIAEAKATATANAERQAARRLGGTVSRDASVSDRAFANAMRDLAKPKAPSLRELYPPEATAHLIAAGVGFAVVGLLNRAATVLGRR